MRRQARIKLSLRETSLTMNSEVLWLISLADNRSIEMAGLINIAHVDRLNRASSYESTGGAILNALPPVPQ